MGKASVSDSWRKGVAKKYGGVIREKAITRAKARIALSGRSPTELSEEELEIIVKEEEDKIRQLIVGSSAAAALVILGIY